MFDYWVNLNIKMLFFAGGVIVLGGCFAVGIYFIISIFSPPSPKTSCERIPKGSIIFAPAFLNLGVKDGVFIPGSANQQIADALKECAKHIRAGDPTRPAFIVFTQKAVSDALQPGLEDGEEIAGIQVFQMHNHDPEKEVRTFAALKCALERFKGEIPKQIILLAHPRHIGRAAMNLRALYTGKIMKWHPDEVVYPKGITPFEWAKRNLKGWIGDSLLMFSLKYPRPGKLIKFFLAKYDAIAECPSCVQLAKVVEKNGIWSIEPK